MVRWHGICLLPPSVLYLIISWFTLVSIVIKSSTCEFSCRTFTKQEMNQEPNFSLCLSPFTVESTSWNIESVSGHLLEEVHDQLPVKTSILRAYLRMSGSGKRKSFLITHWVPTFSSELFISFNEYWIDSNFGREHLTRSQVDTQLYRLIYFF